MICVVPLVNGGFHFNLISDELIPTGWQWNGDSILLILGCFTVAQWSAVGWESAATYGAEYKEPSRDVPKALMACGLMCLFMYFIISFCMYGTLGIDGITEAGAATLIPVAEIDFGKTAGAIAVFLLIAGMVMIIQTAFLGTARTIQIMAREGNFPFMFSKTNSYGVPINAMLFEAFIGFVIILAGITASQILAVSALGFAIALGMCMLAFIKSRRDPRFKDAERIYKAPRWAMPGAIFMAIFEFFFMIPGLLYYVYVYMGFGYCIVGVAATMLYVPAWIFIQWWNSQKHPDITPGVNFEKESNPQPKLMGAFAIVGAILVFSATFPSWIELEPVVRGFSLFTIGWNDDFFKYIPVIELVLSFAVLILQTLNFLKPEGSKGMCLAALVLSVIALALGAYFLTWGLFPAFNVGIGAYVGITGAILAVIFSVLQTAGMYGHNVRLGRLSEE